MVRFSPFQRFFDFSGLASRGIFDFDKIYIECDSMISNFIAPDDVSNEVSTTAPINFSSMEKYPNLFLM